MTTQSKKPAHTIRYSNVNVAIWAHTNPKGPNYSVSLERRFQKDGEWKSTSGFFREDLHSIQKALDDASAWISSRLPSDRKTSE